MFIPTTRLAIVLATLALPATASAHGESSIVSGPPQSTNDTQAKFTFTSTHADDVFQCKLDGAPSFSACPNPYTTPELDEGPHTLVVRTAAPGGTHGWEETPTTHTWTVDLNPPNTKLLEKPAPSTSETSAKFVFESNDASATFLCSLNGASPQPCTSPKTYGNLSDGERTFVVRAVDAAGNQDTTPESVTWSVDHTAPDTQIVKGPDGAVSDGKPSFEFGASETATYECKVDGAAWGDCPAQHSVNAWQEGAHTLEVRAKDVMGLVDATPAVRTWTRDSKAEYPQLFVGPGTPNQGRSTKKLVVAKAAQRGPQTLAVTTQQITKPFQLTRHLLVTWGSGGDSVSYEVESLRVGEQNCTGGGGGGWFPGFGGGESCDPAWKSVAAAGSTHTSAALTGISGSEYCFRARAKDAVGNVSEWRYSCTSIPYKGKKLKATGYWKQMKHDDAFLGEYVRGQGAAKLETVDFGKGVQRIGIVVTKCPTCGKIRVQAPGVDKLIDLVQEKTVRRALITIKLEWPSGGSGIPQNYPSIPGGLGTPNPNGDWGGNSTGQVTITRMAGKPHIEGVGLGG